MSMRAITYEQKSYGAIIRDKHEMEQKQYTLFTIFMTTPKGLLLQEQTLEMEDAFF